MTRRAGRRSVHPLRSVTLLQSCTGGRDVGSCVSLVYVHCGGEDRPAPVDPFGGGMPIFPSDKDRVRGPHAILHAPSCGPTRERCPLSRARQAPPLPLHKAAGPPAGSDPDLSALPSCLFSSGRRSSQQSVPPAPRRLEVCLPRLIGLGSAGNTGINLRLSLRLSLENLCL